MTFHAVVIDVASGEYGNVLPKLVDGMENGRRIYQENSVAASASPSLSHGKKTTSVNSVTEFSVSS